MFYVYLLSSRPHGTLYAGMTNDLAKRVWQHKIKAAPGFEVLEFPKTNGKDNFSAFVDPNLITLSERLGVNHGIEQYRQRRPVKPPPLHQSEHCVEAIIPEFEITVIIFK